VAQVIRYKLYVALHCFFALCFFSLPHHQLDLSHFCSVWGPLETRHGKREFSGISYGGGGNFLISEREFPVALPRSAISVSFEHC